MVTNRSQVSSGFPNDASPMAIMCGPSLALYAFYQDHMDITYESIVKLRPSLNFKMRLASICYKYSKINLLFTHVRPNLCRNFCTICLATHCEDYQSTLWFAKAMDKISISSCGFHEQNASTRCSLAWLFWCKPIVVCGWFATLWGPAMAAQRSGNLAMLEKSRC